MRRASSLRPAPPERAMDVFEPATEAFAGAQEARTQVAMADLVPMASSALLAAALGLSVDGDLRASLARSPRLRRIAGDEICRLRGLPDSVALPDGPAQRLLLQAGDDELDRVLRRCAACLAAPRIRHALRAFEVAELRARYGDEAYEAALEHEGPLADGAAGLAGIDAGRLAMSRWIGRHDPSTAAYLSIRFGPGEIERLHAIAPGDPDPAYAEAFALAARSCFDG